MRLRGLRWKHTIFLIPFIIVAPLCPVFLKRVYFHKAHLSEKHGVLWLAQLSTALWLAEHLKHVTEMLRPLPYLETHSVSTTWLQRQQYYSKNKTYAFFLWKHFAGVMQISPQWCRHVEACLNKAF